MLLLVKMFIFVDKNKITMYMERTLVFNHIAWNKLVKNCLDKQRGQVNTAPYLMLVWCEKHRTKRMH
jgi:hypothetical protein